MLQSVCWKSSWSLSALIMHRKHGSPWGQHSVGPPPVLTHADSPCDKMVLRACPLNEFPTIWVNLTGGSCSKVLRTEVLVRDHFLFPGSNHKIYSWTWTGLQHGWPSLMAGVNIHWLQWWPLAVASWGCSFKRLRRIFEAAPSLNYFLSCWKPWRVKEAHFWICVSNISYVWWLNSTNCFM